MIVEKRVNSLDELSMLAQHLAEVILAVQLSQQSAVPQTSLENPAKKRGWTLYLKGDLGAGKTTFTQLLLKHLGYTGKVKSPTYTLLEVYDAIGVNHFDLYRLGDPEELEFIGIEHYFDNIQSNIIEWPEKGVGYLPKADVSISFETITGKEQARVVTFESHNDHGKQLVAID